jgi:hypothetical protein
MPGNIVYRLYSDAPPVVYDWLETHVRPSIVRFSGTKLGPGDWYYITVVLDDQGSSERFQEWLDVHGTSGRLTVELRYPERSEMVSIDNAIWISKPVSRGSPHSTMETDP